MTENSFIYRCTNGHNGTPTEFYFWTPSVATCKVCGAEAYELPPNAIGQIHPPPGQGQTQWWLASDGNWYPPQQHPINQSATIANPGYQPLHKPKARSFPFWVILIPAGIALVVGVFAFVIGLLLALGSENYCASKFSYLSCMEDRERVSSNFGAVFGVSMLGSFLLFLCWAIAQSISSIRKWKRSR